MNEPQESISREQLLGVVRRRWWVVVQLVVVGAAVGALLAYASPERYEATATVVVGPTVSGQTQSGGLTAETAARLVQTRAVAERAVRELDGSRSAADVLADVSAEPDDSGAFVDITGHGDTAAEAADLANAFADAFVAARLESVRARTQEAVEAVEKRLDSLPPGDRERRELRAQLAQLRSTALIAGIDAQVVDSAVARTVDEGDDVLRAGLAGAGLGLLLGLVLSFALEALDPRIRRLDELRRLVGAPRLAAMPSSRALRRRSPDALAASSRTEAVEHLRGALLVLGHDRQLDRLIVTSPSDRDEGKTAVAANLAVSLARLGKRVCLVDADLRDPMLAAHFGIDGQRGLVEALRGAPLGDVVQRIDMPDQRADNGSAPQEPVQLTVLPAGDQRTGPAELLAGGRMAELLAELDRDHDIVILDCAPLLAVSDTLPLLQRASGTIIVVRHGRTARRAIARAADVVAEGHGTMLGVVATGVPKRELAVEGQGPWPSPAASGRER